MTRPLLHNKITLVLVVLEPILEPCIRSFRVTALPRTSQPLLDDDAMVVRRHTSCSPNKLQELRLLCKKLLVNHSKKREKSWEHVCYYSHLISHKCLCCSRWPSWSNKLFSVTLEAWAMSSGHVLEHANLFHKTSINCTGN